MDKYLDWFLLGIFCSLFLLVPVCALFILGDPIAHKIEQCQAKGGTYFRYEGKCGKFEEINLDK